MEKEVHLKKNIGFAVATSLVVGTVIGSGIFMKPGIVISATGNSTLALLAWIIGGIITLASGLTIAEVSVKIPKTGGLYAYIEEVYGKQPTLAKTEDYVKRILSLPMFPSITEDEVRTVSAAIKQFMTKA